MPLSRLSEARPSTGSGLTDFEFLFDAFEVFGGSELSVEVVGDRVVVLGAIGVVAALPELSEALA
ncbi:MAG: hypothetical protein ACFB9N_17850 [Geitlerinemataceae cyanobacterium]